MKKKISPKIGALLDRAIAAKAKEDAFIESLTSKQKKIYIELWAYRIAVDLSKATD